MASSDHGRSFRNARAGSAGDLLNAVVFDMKAPPGTIASVIQTDNEL
jgi:hypothetical protein